MSERLRTLIDQLRASLHSLRYHRTFLAARQRWPALARYSSMGQVLAELAGESASAYGRREAITRALLAEHRGGQDSLWASALVVAYYPMLSHLRHRLVCHELTRDDLDQIVLESFLAVLRELLRARPRDRIALHLRQRTARAVFAVLRKEREERRLREQHEQLCRMAPGIIEPGSEPGEQAVLLLHAGRSTIAAMEPVLVHTVLQQEQLRSYVNRTVEGDPPTRERAYQRLKRQRSRVLHRMRALVSMSTGDGSDALAGEAPSTPAGGPDDPRRLSCV